MLKQGLSQKLLQKLSPQQIQLMKLLQVPTAQLEQRIKEELEVNPALDEGNEEEEEKIEETTEEKEPEEEEEEKIEETGENEELDLEDYYDEDDIADYKLKDNNYPDPDEQRTIPIALEKSFHEFLEGQLGLLTLEEEEYQIAEQIVGSIDDDGYMRRELEAVVDDLAFAQNVIVTTDQVEAVLLKIQEFDPAGVGARDLQECLLIQLKKLDSQEVAVKNAKIVLTKYFEHFTKKHYERLQRSLNIDESQLKEAIDEILKLNPKPGSGYSTSTKTQQYVTPDYFIVNNDGELGLTLNSRNAPELRISRNFKEMLLSYKESKEKNKEQKEAVMFIKQKIDSAKWFIDAIMQRQNTLLGVMETLMEYQYEFFISGDETKLKPMILKDIAEKIGLDISTISRVANSKYVQTEFGTFPLKSFFSESLQTDSGEEVSTREVKKILSNIMEEEDKKKPHSDQKLMTMLNDKGYNIARRTVAKYREQLNIPVARLRKEL